MTMPEAISYMERSSNNTRRVGFGYLAVFERFAAAPRAANFGDLFFSGPGSVREPALTIPNSKLHEGRNAKRFAVNRSMKESDDY